MFLYKDHLPEYISYQAMKQRCLNPNNTNYHHYGGRGIKICRHWRVRFENFYIDMGDRPKKYSLDRIDNNGNYSCGECEECLKNDWPSNCRWATAKEQANNTRRNTTKKLHIKRYKRKKGRLIKGKEINECIFDEKSGKWSVKLRQPGKTYYYK